MLYSNWHKKTVAKSTVKSEKQLYLEVTLFSAVVYAGVYGYLQLTGVPSILNKSVADTSVLLMGFSMILSSLCYFWNFMDTKIIYRKHLGLVGFAFALTHTFLSSKAVMTLISAETWEKSIPWPALTGAVALGIFTVMAAISNQYAAHQLGGKIWRTILRTGYLAILLVSVHVYLLKSGRWMTWYEEGMKTLPSLSLLITLFIFVVVLLRVLLWISLKRKTRLA